MERRWWGLLVGSAAIVAAVAARGALATPWWWVLQNLALAWVPVAVGALAARSRTTLVLLGPVWLAFLPNAPYLLTDLVHLKTRAHVPIWFDACLLGGLAALGLALGARSVAQLASAVRASWGDRAALTMQILVPPACGFAMVLGRVLRFNSWDLATDPDRVLGGAARLILRPQPELWAMALVFAVATAAAVWCADDRAAPWPTPSS